MNPRSKISAIARGLLVIALLGGLLHGSSQPAIAATQIDILGPNGSVGFGSSVTVLPNGNIVVADPWYSGIATLAGAVYLIDGGSGALISMLVGTTAEDQIGSKGVIVLSNGNYVVRSPNWDNGAAVDAGAATWGSAISGVSGAVSDANSLVGSTGELVGNGDVIPLSNGNYVVSIPTWHNGAVSMAGAATWGDGTSGVSGTISAFNSLVGSSFLDAVGGDVIPLSNGNYVVRSLQWHNGATNYAGAVTWGDGTGGVTGVVSAANSLVGSQAYDGVGFGGVTVLSNGSYVVLSHNWDNGAVENAGAVTWGSANGGVTGVVSAANSLVGSQANDYVGCLDPHGNCFDQGVTPLSNGGYVVGSPGWDNGAVENVGAVTWGSGTGGLAGPVSAANSLVGSTAGDQVGSLGAIPLTNGGYVVSSPAWNYGALEDAGAVTWGSGTGGIAGAVSAANSLVGSKSYDMVGEGDATALTNGNYVVSSPGWDNGAVTSAGAATWGSGTGGIAGAISAANSLVGSTNNDMVSSGGVAPLSNGSYVVSSPEWDNGAAYAAGAATWGDGTSGVSGMVTVANSLVGSQAGDQVSSLGVTPLTNGSYVVKSPFWDNGVVTDAGAATWGSGTGGVTGAVSAANSLVGSTAYDKIGCYEDLSDICSDQGVTPLNNGSYVVLSPAWDDGAGVDAGAVTWGSGTGGLAGVVSAANSLVGIMIASDIQFYLQVVYPLSNGDYVVKSPNWANGAINAAGAVTWGSGTGGVAGAVSALNSLVGSTSGDQVGASGVIPLTNGSYWVKSPYWDNGAVYNVGAVSWSIGANGIYGPVTTDNSVLGASLGGGIGMFPRYDAVHDQLVVGRPADNIVTLFTTRTLPGAFLKSSPTNGSTGLTTSPTLAWGASSAAASYEYCYDTTDDDACDSWISNGPATSQALSGLSTNTIYYWQVRAINGDGATYADNGAWWSFTTSQTSEVFLYLPMAIK